MIVSQRPSEISETILSQCNSMILMRMNNPDDQEYAARVVSDQFRSLINLLPSMKPGEGFIIGDSVLMPMRTLIDMPPKVPQSANVDFFGLWSSGGKGCNVDRIVDRWWRQERSAAPARADARAAEEHKQPAATSAEPIREAPARPATPTVVPDEQNQVSPPEPATPSAPAKPAEPVVEAPPSVPEPAAATTPAEEESAKPKSAAEQKLARLAAILGGGTVAE